MSYGHISQRRRTFGPTADFVLSQAHLLPYRRRYVLRRLRPLCGHQRARRGGSIEIRNTRTGAAIHLTDVPWLDHRFLCHRVHRRPLWAAFHVSVQPDDLRACLARGSVRARHDDAQHSAFRYGSGPRCRNRGRLFHHDRVRAAADARSLARLYVVYRGVRAAGNRATWLLDHPELRLAADVRDLRPRLARCLVSPQTATGVAALARDAGRDRGSRGADAGDREGGRDRSSAATAPAGDSDTAIQPKFAFDSVFIAQHGRRVGGANHDQHADLRFRAMAADLLRSARFEHHQMVRLHARDHHGVADRLRHRRVQLRLLRSQALTHCSGPSYDRTGFMHEASGLLTVGFLLIVAIYVQVAILFGVYTPELFPTEVRLRANGICNTIGRAATIVSPFIVLALFLNYGLTGVLALMIGLLIIHIIVIAVWGIEPANRSLEDLESVAA